MPDHGEQAPAAGVFGASPSANGAPSPPLTPADVLEQARVDLIELIRNGIPPRKFVPGCHGRFAAGKRHQLAATRKSGKSIANGVVDVVDIIEAGGTVAVLDRENGQDEYASRLNDVLRARNAGPELMQAVRERFRYYAWPSVRLEWALNSAYPDAFKDVDLVIFDSSRKFLTHVKLEENKSDDYSKFTEALIDPLMRAGIATLILDNTGHEDKRRSRGTSSKDDLADVIFSLKKTIEFSRKQTGRVELTCEDSRFGDIYGRWTMTIGGGTYEAWERPDEDGKELFREAAVAALLEDAPLGRDPLIQAARQRGAQGRSTTLRAWLAELSADPVSGIVKTTEGYVPEGWSQSGTRAGPPPPRHPPGPPVPPYGDQGQGCLGPESGPGAAPDVEEKFAGWTPYRSSVNDEQDDDGRKDLV